jgi:hypothetical protein
MQLANAFASRAFAADRWTTASALNKSRLRDYNKGSIGPAGKPPGRRC